MFKHKIAPFTAALVLAFSVSNVSATLIGADIANVGSCDGLGAGCNITASFDFGAALGSAGSDVSFDGLGWDVTIDTVGASWLSEAVISFSDVNNVSLFDLTPGVGDSFPGTAFYTSGGVIDLEGALGAAPILEGGILNIEFYESFDDVAGTFDAFYTDPSILTFDVSLVAEVAEPGMIALLGVGLLGLAIARRRRG